MATGTVLVVDDNPTILALVSYLLSRTGHYEVVSTPNPKIALEILSGCSVNVVVSDVEMPELAGPELVREIRQTFPAIGCVLMSATRDRIEEVPPDVPFLSKPIDAAELYSAVERVLSESLQGAQDLGYTLDRVAELRHQACILKSDLDQTRQAVATTISESLRLRQQK